MHDDRLGLKTSREARERAGVLVSQRKPFSNTTGSFRGVVGMPGTFGWLPEPWRSEFPNRVDYTIMSWDTPLAWLVDGVWTMPDVKYSQFTSIQQGAVRMWLRTETVHEPVPTVGFETVTLAAVRRANAKWFSPETMRWWRARVGDTGYRTPNGAVYFVSSEMDIYATPPHNVRRYTVRVWKGEGHGIDTVGEFAGYSSWGQANKAARAEASVPTVGSAA
jgi:hypothetical protein